MAHHTNPNYPAGFIVPGDRLVISEAEALEVVDVVGFTINSDIVVPMVALTLEDGSARAHCDAELLTVEVLWPE